MTAEQECWLEYCRFIGRRLSVGTYDEIDALNFAIHTLHRATEAYPEEQIAERLIKTYGYWKDHNEPIDSAIPAGLRQACVDKLDELFHQHSLYELIIHGDKVAEQFRKEREEYQEAVETVGERPKHPIELILDKLREATRLAGGPADSPPRPASAKGKLKKAVQDAVTTAAVAATKEHAENAADGPEKIIIHWPCGEETNIIMVGMDIDMREGQE